MNTPLRHPRVLGRSLAALTAAAALAAGGLAVAPAAIAGTPGTSAALFGSTDATYDGVYRQSLAILGLHAAGVTPDPTAVQWLLDQQCTNHGFTSFDEDTSTRCTAPGGAGGADSNATAVAAQALLAVGKTTEGLAAATFLRDSQSPDGGWEYTIGSGWGADPNSTGLVLTALNAAELASTTDPAPFFADRQVGRVVVENAILPDDEGAIAYNLTGDYAGADTLATVQSIPGLNGVSLLDVAPPAPWADEPTTITTTPPAIAEGITDWATTWLGAQSDAGAISASSQAWAVLAFASNGTARNQAVDTYEALRSGVLNISTNPAALGQSALAAAAIGTQNGVTKFGSTTDLTRYSRLIEQTLSAPVFTPLPVTPDTTKPKVALTKPAKAAKVSSWRTLRGTTADAGGIATVSIATVQKRGKKWYSYTGTSWKKRSTLKKARNSAKVIVVEPRASGRFTLKVKKLRKGTLKVKVFATDLAANRSKVSTTTAALKKK